RMASRSQKQAVAVSFREASTQNSADRGAETSPPFFWYLSEFSLGRNCPRLFVSDLQFPKVAPDAR
ncbi:MAG: hypothetical protein DMG97_07895, partial [Acidobacteria bacterium]